VSNPANAPRQIRLSELSHLLTLINMGSDAARRCLALSQEHSREAMKSGIQVVPAGVLNGQAPMPGDQRSQHRQHAAQLLQAAQAEIGAIFGHMQKLAAEINGAGEHPEAQPDGGPLGLRITGSGEDEPDTSSPK